LTRGCDTPIGISLRVVLSKINQLLLLLLRGHGRTRREHQAQGLLPTEILLDNVANISVMNSRLLKSVRPAGKRIRVKGVGGVQMVVDCVGDLEGFFEVYASYEAKANVLSFAAVEDMYEVTYNRGEGFTVHMPEKDIP
jgi:hypothetical protein